MANNRHNPDTNVPEAGEPQGDLGHKGKTWSPGQEQGISNRPGDEDAVGKGEDDDEFEDDEDSEEMEEAEEENNDNF
jgi:hypothetical protein